MKTDKIKIVNINKYCYRIVRFNLSNIFCQKYLIIDLEATGINYKTEDIIEIAIMPIINGKKISKESWSTLIKTSKKIPKFIEKLTGIKNENLNNSLSIGSVLNRLVSKYKDYVWVGQCSIEFDFPFLEKVYYSIFGKKLLINKLDTKIMYKYLYPKTTRVISTDFLLRTYGIDATEITRHRAANDVKLITEIFLRILSEYQQKNINKINISKPIIVKKFVPNSI